MGMFDFFTQTPTNPMEAMRRQMQMQQLGNLGLGLIAAGQPVPMGQTRMGMFANAMQQNQPSMANQMAMFKLQQEMADRQRQQQYGKQLAGMFGGMPGQAREPQSRAGTTSGTFAPTIPHAFGQPQQQGMFGQTSMFGNPFQAAASQAFAAGDIDTGMKFLEMAQKGREPAKTRERKVGDKYVFEEFDPRTGQWTPISEAPRYRPETNVNVDRKLTEFEARENAIQDYMKKFQETGDEQWRRRADQLRMQQIFGGKPPQAYTDVIQSVGDARYAIENLYNILSEKGQQQRVGGVYTATLIPEERARVKQWFEQLKLSYATLQRRGANFTESEQEMIGAAIGGNPNDIIDRALRGTPSYLSLLQNAAAILERRGQNTLRSFTTPGAGEFKYPWEQGGGPARITNDAAGKAAYDALPSGSPFIDPEGKTRIKP